MNRDQERTIGRQVFSCYSDYISTSGQFLLLLCRRGRGAAPFFSTAILALSLSNNPYGPCPPLCSLSYISLLLSAFTGTYMPACLPACSMLSAGTTLFIPQHNHECTTYRGYSLSTRPGSTCRLTCIAVAFPLTIREATAWRVLGRGRKKRYILRRVVGEELPGEIHKFQDLK